MLAQYHDVFDLNPGEHGKMEMVSLEIDTGDTPPQRQPLRRMPYVVRQEVIQNLAEMQRDGVIQPSKSPWSSPIVLVKKKDGSHRFCIDYRGLNTVTKADPFPLPRIEDILDQLGESKYFSTIDLSLGFWQIRAMTKLHLPPHKNLFEFRVIPFGLTNTPSVFQSLMQQVIMCLNPATSPDFVSINLHDEILVFS